MNIHFSIEALPRTKYGENKALTPDENGVFKDIPVGVIGAISKNTAAYDVDSYVNGINNPSGALAYKLKNFQLIGEYGHPIIYKEEDVARIFFVDEKNESHTILKLYTKQLSTQQGVVVFADILPSGPYGNQVDKAFRHPKLNIGFSQRTYCPNPKVEAGTIKRKIVKFITFDAVKGPGYEIASGRSASGKTVSGLGNESIQTLWEKTVNAEDMREASKEYLGLESIQELQDILQRDEINFVGLNGVMFNKDNINQLNGRKPGSVFFNAFGM